MTPEQPLRGNAILIVDDDADSVATLERLIAEEFGCRVLTTSSGDEALARYRLGPAHLDFVFADVVMPEMDGVTLAHLIGGRLPSLPVVLVTGRSDVVDSVTERGGIAYLSHIRLKTDKRCSQNTSALRVLRRRQV